MRSGNRGIYFSPKLEDRTSKINSRGLFAVKRIHKGEVILDLSSIKAMTVSKAEADKKYKYGFDYMLQIAYNKFIVIVVKGQSKKYGHVNHSCTPNCGIKNSIRIVAMRNIWAGEEVTFDYAMSESSDYTMKCNCRTEYCIKSITGNDWKIKELQERYNGFFSDYLQKKIKSRNS